MNKNERDHDETIEQYHERLKDDHNATKQLLKGRLIWDSFKQGTYCKKTHGPLS